MRWSSTSRIRAGRLSPTESDVMPLRLTLAFSDNPRVQPLKDGLVKPQGIELDCITLDPSNLFQRNLTYDEFDVSEMSISETLLARERTDGKKWDWSALPVFLSRGHHWHTLYVNTASGSQEVSERLDPALRGAAFSQSSPAGAGGGFLNENGKR